MHFRYFQCRQGTACIAACLHMLMFREWWKGLVISNVSTMGPCVGAARV